MRGARRNLAVRVPRRRTDECLTAGDCGGGDARPHGTPEQMRARHHASQVDLFVGRGNDVSDDALGPQHETLAARAAHAERIPAVRRIERVGGLQKYGEHLIRRRRIFRAPGGGDDAVGFQSV